MTDSWPKSLLKNITFTDDICVDVGAMEVEVDFSPPFLPLSHPSSANPTPVIPRKKVLDGWGEMEDEE